MPIGFIYICAAGVGTDNVDVDVNGNLNESLSRSVILRVGNLA